MVNSDHNDAINSPAGQAPQDAWKPKGGAMRRSEEHWLAGDPRNLGAPDSPWSQKFAELQLESSDSLGLRVRFVLERIADFNVLGATGHLINRLRYNGTPMFLHAEVMVGPEEGVHLAQDNRSPALLTQVWVANKSVTPATSLPAVAGPLHLNLALHDHGIGFAEIWNDGTLEFALERFQQLSVERLDIHNIHQISMARSQLKEHGISMGVEGISDEVGAFGGHSATEPESRL